MNTPLRLVVIGGVAAGTKAASKARRENPDMDITIFTEEPYISYAGCGLAYYVGGISRREQLFARQPETFREKQRIAIRLRHHVEEISATGYEVTVTDLEKGTTDTVPFDRLLIATGASAAIPPIPGTDLAGAFPLHRIPDADAIRDFITEHHVRHACIIGAGYIGMELPENLANHGIKSTIIEMADTILPGMLDPDMSKPIHTHLAETGTTIVTGARVEAIVGRNNSVRAVIAGGQEYPCEMVIIVTGVRPNVALADAAEIAIGTTGAIQTNRHLETSRRHIYAAGDCAESMHVVTGRPTWLPLGSTANKHGRVAGANIAGEHIAFGGVAGTSIVKVGDLAAGRTGLSENTARTEGFDPVSFNAITSTRAGYYPGGTPLTLKLTADRESRRIIGAQAIGRESVAKVIDTCAAAVTGSLTVDQLVDLDTAYAPPFSQALGSVIVAAQVLERKLA